MPHHEISPNTAVRPGLHAGPSLQGSVGWRAFADTVAAGEFVFATASPSRIVNADGGSPAQLPIAPGCGGPLGEADAYGCYSPDWSPDGDRIVFTRSEPDGSNESIWIVNADGTGLVQVTDGADDNPTWGTPPTST